MKNLKPIDRLLPRQEFETYEDFKLNYKLNIPDSFQFARDVVDEWAALRPDKLALLWCDDHGRETRFSFSDISRLSKKAAGFLSENGIKKGDRVMLMLRRRYEYWIIAVALHRLGAVLIPASVQLTAKDIVYRANTAGIKMILAINDDFVCTQIAAALPDAPSVGQVALIGGSRHGWLDFSAALPFSKEPESWPQLEKDDPFIMYFTSGTTGMPKGVLHNQLYPLGHIVTAKYMQNVKDDGLHLTVADSGWAKFGWGCIYGQWICGSAVLGYDPDKFDAANLIRTIREKKPTTVCVPPTIYRFMLKHGIESADFASVFHCSTAGEPLSPAVSEAFSEITGLAIHEGFGQSEGPVLVCTFPWVTPRFGSMGKPSPAYDIAIVKPGGAECAPGEIGEIVLRGLSKTVHPGLIAGLLTECGMTPAHDGTYHTKDIAYADGDGYYWYVGRNDDVIKSSGYRIGPYEIESVLNTHPAVLECAISGAPDPVRGQVVCALVVLNSGFHADADLTKELQSYVKQLTAPYKYPRVIQYVNTIPKTVSGKIIRMRKSS